jgi:uncharacterized protein involved in type VI secretion and phage assembly
VIDFGDIARELLTFIEGRYFGKYRARVTSNEDPLNRGSLQVTVGVLGDDPVWALPCVPYAGTDVGMFFLPEEGSLVWVEFEGGDTSLPIWTGCFWQNDALVGVPPNRRFIKTKEFTIEIDDETGTLTINANTGGAKLVMTRNQVQLEAAGDITSTVGGRKTKLDVKNFNVHDGALEIT